MRVFTTWVIRKGESVPELLVAVDEYSDDENPEYFLTEKAKQLSSLGDDLFAHADITIHVDEDSIQNIIVANGEIIGEATPGVR